MARAEAASPRRTVRAAGRPGHAFEACRECGVGGAVPGREPGAGRGHAGRHRLAPSEMDARHRRNADDERPSRRDTAGRRDFARPVLRRSRAVAQSHRAAAGLDRSRSPSPEDGRRRQSARPVQGMGHVEGVERRLRRRPVPQQHLPRRARPPVRLRPGRRQAAAALPVSSEHHDADGPHHQRVRMAGTACRLSPSAEHGAHRLRRRLDDSGTPELSVRRRGARRRLARPVGGRPEARA